jgi:hypothetical protein
LNWPHHKFYLNWSYQKCDVTTTYWLSIFKPIFLFEIYSPKHF